MATNFLHAAGSNGFITAPFNLMSTELNALASGAANVSSVGGSSGVFSQSNTSNAQYGSIFFKAGGAFSPAAGGAIWGWFLRSPDGGSTFETQLGTPSATVLAMPRAPDFVIPFSSAATASGNIMWASAPVLLPWESFKLEVQNLTGVALSASGHTIQLGPVADQY